jgi:hypothetical protein
VGSSKSRRLLEVMNADALSFARNVMTLLDQGTFTSTYKYALLIALIELCQEGANEDGDGEIMETRSIAGRMVQLYWGHQSLYKQVDPPRRLTQTSQQGKEITMLNAIQEATATRDLRLRRLRSSFPSEYERLIRIAHGVLRREPLPKLQTLARGKGHFVFIYDWPDGGDRSRIRF